MFERGWYADPTNSCLRLFAIPFSEPFPRRRFRTHYLYVRGVTYAMLPQLNYDISPIIFYYETFCQSIALLTLPLVRQNAGPANQHQQQPNRTRGDGSRFYQVPARSGGRKGRR